MTNFFVLASIPVVVALVILFCGVMNFALSSVTVAVETAKDLSEVLLFLRIEARHRWRFNRTRSPLVYSAKWLCYAAEVSIRFTFAFPIIVVGSMISAITVKRAAKKID